MRDEGRTEEAGEEQQWEDRKAGTEAPSTAEPSGPEEPGGAGGVLLQGAGPPSEPPGEPREEPPPAKKRRRGCAGCLVRALQAAGTVLALVALFALYQWITWPDVARLAEENPESTAFIKAYNRARARAGEEKRASWQPVPYSRISNHLKHAVVASEDMSFFSHDGFDRAEMKKAIEKAKAERKPPRGASTLTQQLAKNLWLSPSRNPWRKVKEALLTRQLEAHLSKRRILEHYLNVVEFGPGIYGAEAAARHYYGKSAAGLGSREAAALAAGLPRPSSWHPGVGTPGYQRRVNTIHGRMGQSRWILGHL